MQLSCDEEYEEYGQLEPEDQTAVVQQTLKLELNPKALAGRGSKSSWPTGARWRVLRVKSGCGFPAGGRGNYYWSFSLTSIGSRSRWFTQDNLSDLRSCGTPRPRGLR